MTFASSCHSIRLNLQRRRLQEDASLQRRVAQMGITSEDAFNPFSDVSDVGGRQVMTGAHVKVGKNLVGMENAPQQSRGKGIRFQTDSRGHMMSNSPNLDVQGKNLKRLSGEALESQVVPHSRGEVTKSFLQLLQAGDSPEDQRRQVLGVLKSNPKLLRDYLKSRGLYVEQPYLNIDSGVKKSAESWGRSSSDQ